MAKEKKIKYYVPGKNRHRRKHYWWRYLLVFLLGQALVLPEFIITLGTAASSVETGSILNMAGVDPDPYLGEKYQSDTILDLVMDLVAKFSNPDQLTIESFNEVSPYIGTLYETYIQTYSEQFGITLDHDIVKTTPVTELGDYLLNALMSTQIAPVLENIPGVSSFLPPEIVDLLLYQVPVASITFQDASQVNLTSNISLTNKDETYTINTRVLPEVATDRKLNWSSSDSRIATVIDGVVTAKADGTTTIIATANDNGDMKQQINVVVSGTGVTPPEEQDPPEPIKLIKRDGKEDLGGETGGQEGGNKDDGEGGQGGEQGDPVINPITAITLGGQLKSISVNENFDTSLLTITATYQDETTGELDKNKVTFTFSPDKIEEGGLKTVTVTAKLNADESIQDTKEFTVYVKATDHTHTDLIINDTGEEVADGYCDDCGELLRIAKCIGDFVKPDFDPLSLLNGLTVGKIVGSFVKDSDLSSNPLFKVLWDTELTSLFEGGFNPMSLLDGLTIGGIMQIGNPSATKEDADKIMAMLWDKSITELMSGGLDFSSLLEGKTLGDIMTLFNQTKPEKNPIMDILWDKGFEELTKGNFLNGLTIKDILGEQENKPLAALQYFYLMGKPEEGAVIPADVLEHNPNGYTIADPDAINSIKLGDLFDCSTGLLKNLANSTINSISSDINSIPLYSLMSATLDGNGNTNKGNAVLDKILSFRYLLEETSINSEADFNAKEPLYVKDTSGTMTDSEGTKYSNATEYNEDGVFYSIKYLSLSDLSSKINNVLETFTICDALNKTQDQLDKEGGILAKLGSCTLGANSLENAFKTLQIKDVLTGNINNPLLMKLKDAYIMQVPAGTDGQTLTDAMNELKLKDVITPNGNKLLTTLGECYIFTAPIDTDGKPLGPTVSDKINDLKLSDVIQNDNNNSLLASLMDCYLFPGEGKKSLTDGINSLQLSAVVGNNPTNKLLNVLKDCYLFTAPEGGETMTNKINSLKLCDIMDTSGNNLLNAIKDCYLFTAPSGGKTLAEGINNVTFYDLFGETIYGESYTGEANETTPSGIWKLMLGDKHASEIKLMSGMTDLVNNMKTNIQTTTLNELSSMGMLGSVGSLNAPLRIPNPASGIMGGEYIYLDESYVETTDVTYENFSTKLEEYEELFIKSGDDYVSISGYQSGTIYRRKQLGDYTLTSIISVLANLGKAEGAE